MNRHQQWRKSSYSNQEGACVEVAHTLDAVRDSKNPEGPILKVGIRELLATVKVERF